MVVSKSYDIKSEVERRLDSIFGDEDESPIAMTFANVNTHQDFALTDLKTFIHSLDDTFSDETLIDLKNEVIKILPVYTADKSLSLFLKLLVSIGQHLRESNSNLHPDGISLIRSTFDSLESAVSTKGISDTDKRSRLLDEAGKFKDFRDKTDISRPVVHDAPAEIEKDEAHRSPSQIMASAIEEIRDLIRAECRALKADLKLERLL